MVASSKVKRLRPSIDSPSKGLNLSWVPDGMDSSSAVRIAVRVPHYVEACDDGKKVAHNASDFQLILDRDTINLMDLTEDVAQRLSCGKNLGFNLTFFDKHTNRYTTLTTDAALMDAIANYWEIRRVPLFVEFYDIVAVVYTQSLSFDNNAGAPSHPSLPAIDDGHADVQSRSVGDSDTDSDGSADSDAPANKGKGTKKAVNDDEPWEEDEEEYVGINDEQQYMADQQGGQANAESAESDSFDHDDLFVDDVAGCELSEHVTNLENPTIALGVTFEDGDTFKRAIRQHAVLNEFEIAALYSESTRYRGYCKGSKSKRKKCKWRIHASQLQDGRTWQIKRMHDTHTCATTSKLDHNCMANNAWVKDRVIDILRDEPKKGAAETKKDLEKKYNIKLSYYVVWDGRQMALDEIQGKWETSFEDAFRFKAEVERTNPGSIVVIDWAQEGKKMRFTRMFVAFKSCVDGFLKGCRPFLGVDSTHLTGRWRGQLASASAVDGHSWLFPVAYGVFESETAENWKWFFQQLRIAIGSPSGLVICTDAGKGIDKGVTSVFDNGVEHRECMRHLVKNFNKRYRGAVFKKHLWPASRAYNQKHFEHHFNIMNKSSPRAMKWIEDNHKHLWTRWRFSHASKCDYVTNNIAETFNSWIRNEKSLPVIPLMDRIRQMIMEKQDTRKTLSCRLADHILPHITKELNAMSRNLQYVIHRGPNNTAEIQGTTKELKTWRHTVDLEAKTCSCQRWQISGLACTHALCLIHSMRNRCVEDYVYNYYSVAMFKQAYETVIHPMTDRTQWPQVEMAFKLWPPRFKRAAGRPRNRRIKSSAEGGTTSRQMKCKRCGQFGHMMKTCNETVYDSDAPPPATPKPKKTKNTKSSGATVSTQQSQIQDTTQQSSGATPVPALTNSPAGNTRSQKRTLVDAPEDLGQRKQKKVTKTTKTKKVAATEGTSKRVSKKKLKVNL